MRSAGRFGACLGGMALVAVAGVSGCQKPDVSRTEAEGSGIAIRYEAPTGSDRGDAAFLRRRKVVEEAASAVAALVEVDRPISVGVVSCDGEGSSYDPELTHVEVCYDEVSETRELFRRAGPRRADDDVAAVMLESLFHETAHALVDVLELRVHGREEDFADQFAALMLLRKGAMRRKAVARGRRGLAPVRGHERGCRRRARRALLGRSACGQPPLLRLRRRSQPSSGLGRPGHPARRAGEGVRQGVERRTRLVDDSTRSAPAGGLNPPYAPRRGRRPRQNATRPVRGDPYGPGDHSPAVIAGGVPGRRAACRAGRCFPRGFPQRREGAGAHRRDGRWYPG